MSKILKTDQGIFIPRDFIKDFEGAEVDASVPGVIVIRSKTGNRPSEKLLNQIDRRRESILKRQGLLDDSVVLIRESREQEME
jgi:hypothetical protein